MSALRILALPLTVLGCAMAADPPVVVQVQPKQISIQQSMDYDEAGVAKRPSVRTQLELAVTAPAGWNVVGIGNIELKEWLCDDGTVMTLADGERSRFGRSSMMRRFGNNGNSGQLSVSLAATQIPTGKAFAKVVGSMQMQVADGAVKEAVLKPVKDLVGQAIEVEGVPGAVLEIESWNDHEIAIGYPSDLEQRIQSFELRTASGERIESNSWGSSSNNDRMTRTLRVRVPADGQLAVRLIPRLKDVTVTFSLANVALPTADQVVRKAARKIVAAPVEEAKPEAAPVRPAGGQAGGF